MTTSYATKYTEEMYRRFGLRESRAPICPRVVAGKRCLRWRRPCVCYPDGNLLDHGRMWVTSRGTHLLTAEPYHVDLKKFDALALQLRPLNLLVAITAVSIWFPPDSTLVYIRHRDDEPLGPLAFAVEPYLDSDFDMSL